MEAYALEHYESYESDGSPQPHNQVVGVERLRGGGRCTKQGLQNLLQINNKHLWLLRFRVAYAGALTTTPTELAPLNRIRVETGLSRFPVHRLAKKWFFGDRSRLAKAGLEHRVSGIRSMTPRIVAPPKVHPSRLSPSWTSPGLAVWQGMELLCPFGDAPVGRSDCPLPRLLVYS
jgi:hypothetical protein